MRYGVALVIGLVIAPLANADMADLIDETFAVGDWSSQVLFDSFITSSYSTSQQLTGGLPDAYRRSRMTGAGTFNNGGIGPAGATVGHFSSGVGWNPSSQGAINLLRWEYDAVAFDDRPGGQTVPTGRLVNFGFLIRQNGIVYEAGPPAVGQLASPNDVWRHLSTGGLTATNFSRYDGAAGKPDFSAAGGLIEIGYLTRIGVTVPAIDNAMGVDNFHALIDHAPVPEPATCVMLLTGIASFGIMPRRRPMKSAQYKMATTLL